MVEKALKAISNSNNLSTGLAHPNDNSRTKEMITKLYNEGEVLNSEEIYKWALANNWTNEGAKDLKDIVDKVNSGKTLRPSQKNMWRENILEIFKEDIKNEESENNKT